MSTTNHPLVLPYGDAPRRQRTTALAPREVRANVVNTTTPLVQWGFITGPGAAGISQWEASDAIRLAYYQNIYVWACAKAIAEDIASLSFRAGMDPADPEDYVEDAPLAQLLGPPTPKSPGGPCKQVSAKTFWEWVIVQLLVTGRFACEQVDLTTRNPSLWPIPSQSITALASYTAGEWFAGYRYGGWGMNAVDLTLDQVWYHWRPSADDFRKPESVLQAARLDVSVATMQDRYDYAFLRNDARPAAVVVHEQFARAEDGNAFEAKFLNEHQGPENAGKPIFVETSPDGATAKDAISITPLGLSQRDAEFIARHEQKIRSIIVAFGVPMTRLGDTSGRTFSNAGQEYFNYYTKLKTVCRELGDAVNIGLAPLVGREYGWFDTQPLDDAIESAKVQAAGLTDLVKTRVIQLNEARAELGLKALPDGDRLLTDEELGLLQGAAAQILVQSVSPPPPEAPSPQPSAVAPSAEAPSATPADAAPTRAFTATSTSTETRDETAGELRVAAYRRRSRRVMLHEAQMERTMRLLLQRQRDATISRLEGKRGRQALRAVTMSGDVTPAADEVYDQVFWREETTNRMRTIFEAIFGDAAATVLEDVKSTDMFSVEDPLAYQFIQTRVNQLAGRVTNTTYEAIKAALSDGAHEGESIPKLADRIRGLFDQTYAHRAETVARTETISAYNGSALTAGMALPTELVAGFEWLSTPGHRTRPAHAAADGQVITTGDRFVVGGTQLAYPGDPAGPAGLVVNCRCTLLTLDHETYQEKIGNRAAPHVFEFRGREFHTYEVTLDALLARSTTDPAPEDGYTTKCKETCDHD